MIIIADTGPLIGLAKINCLYILKSISSETHIPPMVYRELMGKISVESERIEAALNDFINVTKLKTLKPSIKKMLRGLDEGERQSIALAMEFPASSLLLIDDRAGRKVADLLNISNTGLIGILLIAKKKGILKRRISSLLDELRNQGYWLSDEIVDLAIALAKEK